VLDLEEVGQRRRKDEQQLPRQQQNKEHDEVAKLKGERDGSKSPSVAALPALPERIQKPEGDSSPDLSAEGRKVLLLLLLLLEEEAQHARGYYYYL
jgi:hypothetical protein